ncbi:MAG TPA: YabP/YqfC family sporulation protein [Candidatus Gallacutalibacter stercoravium]|nr:YabP/YqfC family sporulation protein [Candidatus Gallacutalibacter stercoravium]
MKECPINGRKGCGITAKRRWYRLPEDERNSPEKANRLAQALQLPASALSGAAHFELCGNREVIVDGCRGVLEYDENRIRINTGKMVTCFCGRGLTIKCLTPESLIVIGFITSIEFSV